MESFSRGPAEPEEAAALSSECYKNDGQTLNTHGSFGTLKNMSMTLQENPPLKVQNADVFIAAVAGLATGSLLFCLTFSRHFN